VVRLKAVRVVNESGVVREEMDVREPLAIEVEYWHLGTDARPHTILRFENEDGVELFASGDFNNKAWVETPRHRGVVRTTCWVPGDFLAEGRVSVVVQVSSFSPKVDHVEERDAVAFQIVDRSTGDGARGAYGAEWPGVVRPLLRWTCEAITG
jgi:lipopolysaccharide transport system ATP-binding protein